MKEHNASRIFVEELDNKQRHVKLNLVLYMLPTTFLGDGSFGPLSRWPDVKYSQPFQKAAKVVLIRYGIRPITDHFCEYKRNNIW